MEINCVAKELNEDFIKEMTILKLKKNYVFIEREEFKKDKEGQESIRGNSFRNKVWFFRLCRIVIIYSF